MVVFFDVLLDNLIWVVLVWHLLVELELEDLLLDLLLDLATLFQGQRLLALLGHDLVFEGIDSDPREEDLSVSFLLSACGVVGHGSVSTSVGKIVGRFRGLGVRVIGF